MKPREQYTIRFPPDASKALREMAEEEDVSAAELIRRAINFYQVKMEAKKCNKTLMLKSRDGTIELVMV
jgi:predicted transcriptional regulator